MAMKQERTKQKIQTLSRYIIEKAECDSYRAGTRSKQWHIEADQKLLDAVGGRSVLLRQAGELEKLTGISGKIIVKWKAVRTEIEKITVSPDAIPLLCQVEQIEDPRERQLSQMELTESWKSRVAQADWLIPYYDHILERLNSGKLVKDVPGLEDPMFFLFLNKTAEERKPLYRRAFSAQVCTIWNGIAQTKQSESKITPTKRFEKIYQSAVLSVLKQYSPLYEEGMSDEELLTAHGILTYAQTLEFKGAVSYRIDDGPAITANEATRWVQLGPVQVQVAEPVKILMIVFMATLLTANGRRIKSWLSMLYIMVWPGAVALLIWKVSDNMSSAVIILGTAAFMMFVVHPEYWKFIVAILIVGVGVTAIVYYVASMDPAQAAESFRFERIRAWLNPYEYETGKAMQALQGLYAIGSGGLWGKGLGNSIQKLGKIPEPYNDYIFSIICEELGIFGAGLVILLFIFLLYRIYTISQTAEDMLGRMLTIGVFSHIALQVILNLLVVTGLFPTTGVTLPFFSYGGSASVFLLMEIGLVLSVNKYSIQKRLDEAREAHL